MSKLAFGQPAVGAKSHASYVTSGNLSLWDGTEVRGDALVDVVLAEGVIQPILFALESDL